MKRFVIFLMLLLPLLLAACTGAQPAANLEAPAAEAAASPTAEPAPPEPTEESVAQAPTGPQMECTLVSNAASDAPAELVALFGVTDTDWVQGPETAPVTIVEYSDFQ